MHKVKRSHCITFVAFALFLYVAGCASLSTDPKLAGTYSAENSEELIFMPDGRVFHAKNVNGKEYRFFLGYYASSSNNPLRRGFAGPSTSPFIGTSFQFSEDSATVTANWDNFRKPKDTWQITYRKNPKAN